MTNQEKENIIEELKRLQTFRLNLASIMIEMSKKGKIETYICLEDAIKIINKEE